MTEIKNAYDIKYFYDNFSEITFRKYSKIDKNIIKNADKDKLWNLYLNNINLDKRLLNHNLNSFKDKNIFYIFLNNYQIFKANINTYKSYTLDYFKSKFIYIKYIREKYSSNININICNNDIAWRTFLQTDAYFKNINPFEDNKIFEQFNSSIIYDFKNMYNVNSDNEKKIIKRDKKILFSRPKEVFRNICTAYSKQIWLLELPDVAKNSKFEAVLVELRILPHLEVLIRNCIYHLGSKWSHTIICGNDNYNFLKNICENISDNIKLININCHNINQNEYNNMLLKKDFWNLLTGDKILLYQEDTLIFKNNIDDFIHCDYIGAPLSLNCTPNGVGNGGFSLRSRMKMIELLDKMNPINSIVSLEVKQYIVYNKLDLLPEDVFYGTYLQRLNIGSVADLESAKKFSCERKFESDTLGMHCFWFGCTEWENEIRKYFDNLFKYQDVEDLSIINSFIQEKDILVTRPIPSEEYITKNTYDINSLKQFILIVDFFNGGGGTTWFLNTIISKYKKYQTFLIVRPFNKFINFCLNEEYDITNVSTDLQAIEFIKIHQHKISKIFFNHTLKHSNKFINFILGLNKEKISITHDYYLFLTKPQPTFEELSNNTKEIICEDKIKNIEKYDQIITQNKININYFNKLSPYNNFNVYELPDYKNKLKLINIDNSNKIVVGLIGYLNELKGLNMFNKIVNYFKSFDKNVSFIVFGYCYYKIEEIKFPTYVYNSISELNSLLEQHKPNLLIELSLWPETYSYTTTLSMITDLPIIYSSKINYSTVEDRLKKYKKSHRFENIEELPSLFYELKQNYFYTIEPNIYYSLFWDKLFIQDYDKMTKKKINENILPYFIYFPQYHEILENNISFYKDYNDIKNLKLLIDSGYKNESLTPKRDFIHSNNIENYNLTNSNLIKKQLDLLKYYNIPGFACYYYWFSTNNVTSPGMLMKSCIDLLFEEANKTDRNIFFIWANESWSNNSAFGNSNSKISNEYDNYNLKQNAINLINYFKQKCYLKINNKPVLFLYHTWLMPVDKINKFNYILNNLCLDNGFSGIILVLNSMAGKVNDEFNHFYLNFNYKKDGISMFIDKQRTLNYNNYINTVLTNTEKNDINTICFDFDNNARLFKPNRQEFSTICKENNEFQKYNFVDIVLSKYNSKNISSDLDKILLINSWNEWGEKMACEPSQEIGYYYLNLICNLLQKK
jgi:hypothetical protein